LEFKELILQLLEKTFILATLVQVAFWILIFSRFIFHKDKNENEDFLSKNEENDLPAVSVIICAKNEEKNLTANLDRILTQAYHSFEVLVIDDDSTDKTFEVLLEYSKKYSYLRIIKNSYIKKSQGKKSALALGIKESKHEIVLLTDADCSPNSENWIRSSVDSLGKKDILLGYGPYFQHEGFLNSFIRFETILSAIQYFSFAKIGLPYMGVGRNLCYRKKLFEQVGGFSSHENVSSGDDDLFINQVANKKNVAICTNYENFNYSEPKLTWESFVKQKTRHLTTGKYYRWYHQLLLSAFAGSHAWHYFGGVLLLTLGNIHIAFWGYITRILLTYFLYYLTFKKLRERSLLTLLPVLDAAMAIYYVCAAPISLFIAKTKQWK
jgi:poly-beta-1,6-N-acetyl-D-glucosamine synthase